MADVHYHYGTADYAPQFRPELMRLGFAPSEVLQQDIVNLLSEEGKRKLGRQARFLCSEHAETVRRINGSLRGHDLEMATDLQKIINTAPRVQKLAQFVTGELVNKKNRPSLFALRMGVALDLPTATKMQARPSIPTKFRVGRTVPIRTVFPYEALEPDLGRRREAFDKLSQDVLGDSKEINFQKESTATHASVTNMAMIFRQLHP